MRVRRALLIEERWDGFKQQKDSEQRLRHRDVHRASREEQMWSQSMAGKVNQNEKHSGKVEHNLI